MEDSYQTVPWKFTNLARRTHKKKDKEDENRHANFTSNIELVLSIVAKSALVNDNSCPLTNRQITARMTGQNPETVKARPYITKILNILEGWGWISISNRNSKKRIIRVAEKILDDFRAAKEKKKSSLRVPPEIFLLNISWAMKRFLAVRIGFPTMRIDTMSEKLGLSKAGIIKHYLQAMEAGLLIKEESETPPKSNSNPPKKLYPTPPKSNYRYSLGIDLGKEDVYLKVNGGSLHDAAAAAHGQAPPENILGCPQMREDCYMSPNMAGPTPIKNHHHYDVSNCARVTRRDMGHADKSPKKNVRPEKLKETTPAITELQHEVLQHEFISRPSRPHTLKKTLAIIEALGTPGGVAKVLDPARIRHIIEVMSRSKKFPMTEAQVRAVLTRRFDVWERMELYRLLNDNQSKANGGRDLRRSLIDMVYDPKWNHGFSELAKVVVHGVSPKPKPVPMVPEDIRPAVDMIRKAHPDGNHAWIVRNVKELKEHFDTCPKPPNFHNGHTAFTSWIKDFMHWSGTAEGEQPGERGAYALRKDSRTFASWVGEWWRRGRSLGVQRQARRDYEERAEKDRLMGEVEFVMNEYGLQAAINQFGKELVDKIPDRW